MRLFYPCFFRLYPALAMFFFLCQLVSPLMAAEESSAPPRPEGWSAFQDAKYGATLYYPANWFSKGIAKGGGTVFATLNNDNASLYLKSELDQMRTGAAATVEKLKSGKGAHRIKYIEASDRFYEIQLEPQAGLTQITRVIYTCREQIVSTITLTYPTGQAEAYLSMFKTLKRRFSVGVGAETPVPSCS